MAISIQFSVVGGVFLGELNILLLLEHTQTCIHTHTYLEYGIISNSKKNPKLGV